MKSFIAAIVIALVIVAGSSLYTRQLDGISENMTEYNNEIMNLIHNDDFEGAVGQVYELTRYLDEKKISLSMIMDHSTLDKIESNLSELTGYVEGNNKTDALAKARVLDVLFTYLPKNYKVKLENIL